MGKVFGAYLAKAGQVLNLGGSHFFFQLAAPAPDSHSGTLETLFGQISRNLFIALKPLLDECFAQPFADFWWKCVDS